jgi:hypothetical protein
VILALIAMGRLGSAELPDASTGWKDVRNPAFYPIPQETMTRESYLRCIEETKPAEIARNPNPGAKATYADELQATAHASGIEGIRDDAEASVLRLEQESGRTEWVVFNPQTETIKAAGIETSEPLDYIDAERR